jgi:hypothetical protein
LDSHQDKRFNPDASGLIELRIRKMGSAGNAPGRRFQLRLTTPDLQSGSRITSLDWWREWESHPPEEVYEASLCALVEFPAVKLAFNKEQTPLGDLFDPNPRFHGGCFGVWGHTSCKALKM